MSTERSRPEKMYGTGKRLVEHGCHYYHRYQPYAKRNKLDRTVSEFNGSKIPKGAKFGSRVAVPAKPSRISPPNDAKSETKLLASSSKAAILKQKMTWKNVKGAVKEDKAKYLASSGTSKAWDKGKSTFQHAPLANGLPVSELGKSVSVYKDFRKGFIRVDRSKSGVFIDESSSVQPKSSIGMVKTHDKLINADMRVSSLTEVKLEKNTHSESKVENRSKPAQVIRSETCTEAQDNFALVDLSSAASAFKIDVGGPRVSKFKSRADVSRFVQGNNLRIMAFDECSEVVCRSKVLKSLELFEEQYKKLLQEQETGRRENGQAIRRIDVKAAMILKEEGMWVNTVQEVGEVPGVKIGDQFQYRAELAVVGLHTRFSAGIDYIKVGEKLFATCIVDSGRYNNERRSLDVFIYTGEGGNPEISGKKPEDQKLKCGNLALKTSMDAKLPVRVVQCCQSIKAPNTLGVNNGTGLSYTYQGLYTVSSYCRERDEYGKMVFKFTMKRIPDQPTLVPQLLSYEPNISTAAEKKVIVAGISPPEEKKLNCSESATGKKIRPHYNYNSFPGDCSSNRREYSHPKRSAGPIIRSKGAGGTIIKAKSIAFQPE